MKRLIILIMPLFLSSHYLVAQRVDTSGMEYKRLHKEVSTNVRITMRLIDSVCEAIFTLVTIPVRDGQTGDSLTFTGKHQPYLQESFQRLVPRLRSIDWRQIFPDIKERDYDILLPYTYGFEAKECFDTLSTRAIKHKLSYELHLRQGSRVPSYVLPAMGITFWGRQWSKTGK
ncbi:hypothetical protein [Chitinophaga japonensis]|uniref:Uncharacterized protein n=1 Tax=Chitinophaga japonensis TaxID=104662 RepID=A0A562T3C6_CHIJA|nr:hypothetical protein [Chitinophaga japonensis]TWI87828.1 hypothetical protein LX66_1899 [Chitinophaga japonensis]